MVHDLARKVSELFGSRELAIDEEVAGFEVRALGGDVFDGIAPVPQDTVRAVNVRYLRPTTSSSEDHAGIL